MVRARMAPPALGNVAVEGGFWGPRLDINRLVSLPGQYEQLRRVGGLGAWKLDWRPGRPNPPHKFRDSDVAKWLEAACYTLITHPDPALGRRAERLAGLIAAAQQPDGYLNTRFTVVEPENRWANLRDNHELYCAGHLIEAAVAHHEATGRRTLLDALRRYADLIDRTFGRERGKMRGYPGHQEIELALVRLYRTTGERRYLRLAQYFIDERGRRPLYFEIEARRRGDDPNADWYRQRYGPDFYRAHQAHAPVREQTEAVGHCVRAMYMYSAMADLAAETDDPSLLKACRRLWRSVVRRRMYVTGGVGSTRHGERFTHDYDLPNETAYAETCAAIGLVFFAHRMLRIEADGAYADIMERALYNGVLSGVSLDGRRYFYTNPLAYFPSPEREPDARRSGRRQEWFPCACCPPNLARLFASLGRYVYSESAGTAWVHLFVQGRACLDIGGRRVVVEQRTDYPWNGRVRLTVRPEKSATFTLAVRLPGWCRGPVLRINGGRTATKVVRGYAKVRRMWRPGDRVDLDLPMSVERIEAHPAVRGDCGRVALQRGPLVYCLEGCDNGPDLSDIVLPVGARFAARFQAGLLGGVTVVTARARRRETASWRGSLYMPAPSRRRSMILRAIPYYAWANRAPSEMLVWIRSG